MIYFSWDYKCVIASYADDNSPYTTDISLHSVLEKLEIQLMISFDGLKETT